eukprot:444479-Amphidinium_carterae.1
MQFPKAVDGELPVPEQPEVALLREGALATDSEGRGLRGHYGDTAYCTSSSTTSTLKVDWKALPVKARCRAHHLTAAELARPPRRLKVIWHGKGSMTRVQALERMMVGGAASRENHNNGERWHPDLIPERQALECESKCRLGKMYSKLLGKWISSRVFTRVLKIQHVHGCMLLLHMFPCAVELATTLFAAHGLGVGMREKLPPSFRVVICCCSLCKLWAASKRRGRPNQLRQVLAKNFPHIVIQQQEGQNVQASSGALALPPRVVVKRLSVADDCSREWPLVKHGCVVCDAKLMQHLLAAANRAMECEPSELDALVGQMGGFYFNMKDFHLGPGPICFSSGADVACIGKKSCAFILHQCMLDYGA